MKRSEPWIYAGLLVLALGASWQVSRTEPGAQAAKVLAFDPQGARLTRVVWKEERAETTLEVGEGGAVRVRATTRKPLPPEPAPEGADKASTPKDAASEAERLGPPTTRSFPASEEAAKLLEQLAPLVAMREFPQPDETTLKEMGLGEPSGSLTLEAAGKVTTISVGAKAYGTQDVYARVGQQGPAYLLSSSVVSALGKPEARLMDRSLLGVEEAAAASARFTAPRALELAHQGRHDKAASWWSWSDDAEQKVPTLDAAMEKLFALRVLDYPAEGAAPAAEALEVSLQVEIQGEAGPLGQLTLARVAGTDLHYARTPHTGAWVTISPASAADLLTALQEIPAR